MADELISVQTDGGIREPDPVTIMFGGAAVDFAALLSGVGAGTTVNQPHALTASRWQYAAAAGGINNSTVAAVMAPAAGAGIRNYITGIQCSATALGVGTELVVRDGVGGPVIWRGVLGTAALMPTNFQFPVPLKGSANTLLEVATLTATVTGNVYINAQGFTGA